MTYVQSDIFGNAVGGSSVAVTSGASVTSGNILVVGVSWDNGTAEALSSLADNLGNTYTQIGATTAKTVTNQCAIFYYGTIATGGSCTVTATFLGSRDSRTIVIGEYSGRDISSPINTHSITSAGDFVTGTDGTVTSAIVPSTDGCDIVAICASGGATRTIDPGTGYNEREDDATSAQVQLEDFNQTTAASIVGRWTVSAANVQQMNALVVALSPAAATQQLRPDADTTTTGWTSTPLFSKINESSADGTVITATAS